MRGIPLSRAVVLGWAAALVFIGHVRPSEAHAQLLVADSVRAITVTFGTWIQPRYEYLDPPSGEPLSSMHLRRARLDLGGTAFSPRFQFRLQTEMARAATLMDAYLEWRFSPSAAIRFGQSPVPFHFLVSPRRKQLPEPGLGYATPGTRNAGLSLSGRPASGRLSYHLGLYDGGGIQARRSNSDGHMISVRGSAALSGEVPTEETDPFRQAEWVVALGAGVQAANKNELEDWSLGRSSLRRGDWTTVVGDLQLQHQGFVFLGEYFHRWVAPADAALEPYDGSAWSLAMGFVVPQNTLPPVELSLRRSMRDPDQAYQGIPRGLKREHQTDGAVTLYHRGHNLKTMLAISHRTPDLPGAAARQVVTLDTHLIF